MGGPGPMGGPGQEGDGHRPPFERAFGGHGNEGRWWNNPRIVERLKLTDDQRKQFDQILLQHRETLIDLHANLSKAELALEPLVRDDQPQRIRNPGSNRQGSAGTRGVGKRPTRVISWRYAAS